ncbi:TPA_asm: hypothetical protein [Clonorhabdovirus 1]|nr:TPA_asm: hypothetical protein [Clonorhabdovirus 1]
MGNQHSEQHVKDAIRAETDHLIKIITATFRSACETSLKNQINHVLDRVKAHGISSQRLMDELQMQRDLSRSKTAILPVETERRLRTDISTMAHVAETGDSLFNAASFGSGVTIFVLLVLAVVLSVVCYRQRVELRELRRQKLVRIKRQPRPPPPSPTLKPKERVEQPDDSISLKSIYVPPIGDS